MQTVTHHGRETAYRIADRGSGDPRVVLVHGSGGTHRIWKSQLSRLAREVSVVALDLSGHGDSADLDSTDPEAARAGYVEDLLAVVDATEGDVLVGNSLGGAVVLQAVLETDVAPAAAVLAGSGAKLAVLEDLREWLATDFDRAVEFLHGEDRLFHDPDPRLEALSREGMRSVGRRVTERDFLASHTFDVRDRLGDLEVPTLALTGEHDRLTPPEYHEYLAREIPAGTWTALSDAAHLSMLETPEAFDDAVLSFLQGLG